MIELPEANVLAEQINRTLAGKRIGRAVASASPHKFAWYTGDPAEYSRRLAGSTIGLASAWGNNIEIQAGERLLVITTPIRYHAQNQPRPQKHQLLLEFEDGSAVSCTVQMWGALMLLDEGQESGVPDYPIARQKPPALSNAFDETYFHDLIDEHILALSAKAFLATEQRIPGLGNGVLQDILWTAKIHPRTKMSNLETFEILAMYRSLKSVLREMADCGGRDTERDLFGNPGGYRTILSKNTLGMPCPVCGTVIKKEPYLGGVVYFCEGCQSY